MTGTCRWTFVRLGWAPTLEQHRAWRPVALRLGRALHQYRPERYIHIHNDRDFGIYSGVRISTLPPSDDELFAAAERIGGAALRLIVPMVVRGHWSHCQRRVNELERLFFSWPSRGPDIDQMHRVGGDLTKLDEAGEHAQPRVSLHKM